MTRLVPPWLQTYSGQAFDILAPTTSTIRIEDIAHALSNLCRFAGHVRTFYSVGEHSVRASHIPQSRDLQRAALMHDAAEAYIVDIPSPLKPLLTGYREIEQRIESVIAEKFGVNLGHPLIRDLDLIMLATEKRDLMGPEARPWGDLPDPLPEKIEPWTPIQAEQRFLLRFRELFE